MTLKTRGGIKVEFPSQRLERFLLFVILICDSLRKGAKTRDMEDTHIRYQVHRALSLWQAASRLTFTEVNRDDADIRVSFHSLVSDYLDKPVNRVDK